MKLKKRTGSSYLIVIVAFIFVSLFSALLLSELDQSIYTTNSYALQMQAYYLNHEAASATVAALLQDDGSGKYNYETLSSTYFASESTMEHTYNGNHLGTSHIRLSKEQHDYYEVNKNWIVATINTEIADNRAGNTTGKYTYKGTVMILCENPIVQLYNIDPASL